MQCRLCGGVGCEHQRFDPEAYRLAYPRSWRDRVWEGSVLVLFWPVFLVCALVEAWWVARRGRP